MSSNRVFETSPDARNFFMFNKPFTLMSENLHELCVRGVSPRIEIGMYCLQGFGKPAVVTIAAGA
jgi:hypothetical protein